MIRLIFIILFGFQVNEQPDYMEYHARINEAETLISEQQFTEALDLYEEIFSRYDFVFLRDYKIATQLAVQIDDNNRAFDLLRKGIAAGWEEKDIKRNDFLESLRDAPEWNEISASYDELHNQYSGRIDADLRNQVHDMFRKDQKKALGALFRIGDKAQEKYGVKKFAPHSETQLFQLMDILDEKGYPGEKLIGNNYWMSTILSHHNSMSPEYSKKDTLYTYIKSDLIKAIEKGEMSPYEYALIEDWRIAVSSSRTSTGYGYLTQASDSTLSETNRLRQKIGLRTVELRNKLVDLETTTGMNFYLPDWIKGKITVE